MLVIAQVFRRFSCTRCARPSSVKLEVDLAEQSTPSVRELAAQAHIVTTTQSPLTNQITGGNTLHVPCMVPFGSFSAVRSYWIPSVK